MMIIVLSRLHRVLGTVNDMRSTREGEMRGKTRGRTLICETHLCMRSGLGSVP
jgi:hypothetical protein